MQTFYGVTIETEKEMTVTSIVIIGNKQTMSMKKQKEMGLEQLWVWAVGTSILCGKNKEERMGQHTSN